MLASDFAQAVEGQVAQDFFFWGGGKEEVLYSYSVDVVDFLDSLFMGF